jgi:hypothetical protein
MLGFETEYKVLKLFCSHIDYSCALRSVLLCRVMLMRLLAAPAPKTLIEGVRNCIGFFNTNTHCFIAITKATACGWKELLLSHPLHSPVRGRGKGGASSPALKICLVKTWVALKLSSKANWNDIFNEHLWN